MLCPHSMQNKSIEGEGTKERTSGGSQPPLTSGEVEAFTISLLFFIGREWITCSMLAKFNLLTRKVDTTKVNQPNRHVIRRVLLFSPSLAWAKEQVAIPDHQNQRYLNLQGWVCLHPNMASEYASYQQKLVQWTWHSTWHSPPKIELGHSTRKDI